MEILQDMLLNYGVSMPEWVFWLFIVIVAILVIVFYVFGAHVKKLTAKYDIPFEDVDDMVKMMASLAIRLYVLRKGVEETNKIARIKNISQAIDIFYPTESRIRLSALVAELELEVSKSFSGAELVEHKILLSDMHTSILNELIPVGQHIKDNERDPVVDPKQVAAWINKGISAVDFVKR